MASSSTAGFAVDPSRSESAITESRMPENPMTAAQSACLKDLAEQAFEWEAFNSRLSEAEAARRIEALTAKLRLQDGPPHTL
jgi:hypothetical protein